jgi:hypothetical protein
MGEESGLGPVILEFGFASVQFEKSPHLVFEGGAGVFITQIESILVDDHCLDPSGAIPFLPTGSTDVLFDFFFQLAKKQVLGHHFSVLVALAAVNLRHVSLSFDEVDKFSQSANKKS